MSKVQALTSTGLLQHVCRLVPFIKKAFELDSPSQQHVKHWRVVPLQPVPGWESLLFPAVDGNYYWAAFPWWALKYKLTHDKHRLIFTYMCMPTDSQSIFQTLRAQAELFSRDKSHPVVLRKKKVGGKRSGGEVHSFLFIHFLSSRELWRHRCGAGTRL